MALTPRVERLVLDTSAYSRMRTGHGTVLDAIAAAGIVLVPVTVLGELEAGFELGSRARANRASLAAFLAEPFVAVVETGPAIARRYGRLFAGLRRAGTPIPINDVWIAAATLERDGHLLTFDGHFAEVADLACTVLGD